MTDPAHFIDGAWVFATRTLPAINPSDGRTIAAIGRRDAGVMGAGHGREKGFEALSGYGALKTMTIKHGV